MAAVFFTHHYRIEGNAYTSPGERFSDFINTKGYDFIAITEARIYNLLGDKPLYQVPYLALNRNEVVITFPAEGEAQT